MTKLLAGKISTLLAAFTTSLILSGCETSTSGRPEICKANSNSAACVKPKVAKAKAVKAKAKTKAKVQAHKAGGSHSDY